MFYDVDIIIIIFVNQVLRSWDEPELAEHFNQVGRKLLNPMYDPRKDRQLESQGGTGPVEEMMETASYLDIPLDDIERSSKVTDVPQAKNAELNALEQSLQKLNKQSQCFVWTI